MNEEINSWQLRFKRERNARKESELLLENKSRELWEINQGLEKQISGRTESLKKALEKAQKADDAKSTFLANMSHEIRTPLNAILGFSDLLANDGSLNTQNKKQAEIINSSANNLLTIINDILDISKIESGNFEISEEKTNLHFICDHIVELFSKNAIEKNIKLYFNFDINIPSCILIDGVRLRQVLSNLISNAIKFTPEFGFINIDIKQIKKTNSEVFLNFEIEDTGIGIANEGLKTIFKPFVQIDHKSNRQYQGTGLGLSICSHIIKAFDSKMYVESDIGKGTKFYFDLKTKICEDSFLQKEYIKNLNFALDESHDNLYENIKQYLKIFGSINDTNKKVDLIICAYSSKNKEEIELFRKANKNTPILILFEYESDLKRFGNKSNEEKIALPFYPSKINDSISDLLRESRQSSNLVDSSFEKNKKDSFDAKILIAEDNSANQELISYILEDLGVDFIIKSNGKETFEIFKTQDFDLILMDINMPVLDGVETFKQIREYEKQNNLNKIPIVALTANAIKGDKEKFIDLGMDDYLSKPINTNELIDIFKKFLNNEPSNIKVQMDFDAIEKKLGISKQIVTLIVNKFKDEIKKD